MVNDLNLVVGVAAFVLGIMSIFISITFYLKSSELYTKMVVSLAEIKTHSLLAYTDMYSLVKQGWDYKFGSSESYKETEGLESGKELTSEIRFDEIENEIIEFIRDRGGEVEARYIFENFQKKLGRDERLKIANVLYIFMRLRSKNLIEFNGDIPRVDEVVRLI